MRKLTDPHEAAQAFQRGDAYRKLLEKIFRDHYTKMVNYARNLIKDANEAEDVVMKVMVKLLSSEQLDLSFEENQSITYVFKTIFTYSMHHFRHKNRFTKDGYIPDISIDEDETTNNSELLSAINSLSPCGREVIILYFFYRMDSTQIAQLLNKTPSTIKNLKKRALSMLRKKFNYTDEKYRIDLAKKVNKIFESTQSTKTLAYIYGVSADTIYSIKSGQFFKWATK